MTKICFFVQLSSPVCKYLAEVTLIRDKLLINNDAYDPNSNKNIF